MNDGKFINYYSIHATGLFLYPLKTSGFLMLSRGIKRDQWHEMGRYDKLCSCYRGTLYPLACRKYIPTVNYMLKVNNKNNRTRCEICSNMKYAHMSAGTEFRCEFQKTSGTSSEYIIYVQFTSCVHRVRLVSFDSYCSPLL